MDAPKDSTAPKSSRSPSVTDSMATPITVTTAARMTLAAGFCRKANQQIKGTTTACVLHKKALTDGVVYCNPKVRSRKVAAKSNPNMLPTFHSDLVMFFHAFQ